MVPGTQVNQAQSQQFKNKEQDLKRIKVGISTTNFCSATTINNNDDSPNQNGYGNGKGYLELDHNEKVSILTKQQHFTGFTPKVTLEKNEVLDYICTYIYAYMTILTTIAFFSLIGLLFTGYFYIPIVYYSWVIYDRNTCNRGGRRWPSIYYSNFYKHLADYFPIKLRYSENFILDPNENYILNYHPHGISAFGCVAAFGTDGLNLSERFPGMTSTFMVHETSFLMPVMREVFTSRGDCSVNSKSIDYLLSDKERKGQLLAIVVGGLAEADLSDCETLKIVIAKRKGFIKKALKHGANIIPCIGFGENSVFKKVNLEPDSFFGKFERNFYNIFGFKHPYYYGRSIFNSKWIGLVPYKRPITVCMGDPIMVIKCDIPTQEQIDNLHVRYVNALLDLYKSNHDLCDRFDRQIVLV